MYLEKINAPGDLKKLSVKELEVLCDEIRRYLIDVVSETGGHLASNLGVVELSVALHYVFDEKDKILWDVGHQSYVHKILTGRKDCMKTLRQAGGVSGFTNAKESPADAFTSGHASASLSAALGICKARDIEGLDFNVVSVIGDGALTGGMAYEALNNIDGEKMLVVLNDNDMSISKNVGGVSLTLSRLRLAKGYNNFKYGLTKFFSAIPLIGRFLVKFCRAVKNFFKSLFGGNTFFSNFGVKYIGAVDGNNVRKLVKILGVIKKDLSRPILLHVVTKKGKGYAPAENDPVRYHGVPPKNAVAAKYSFSDALGECLSRAAEKNDEICAVCAAMPDGTGLDAFAARYPERFFDVGIAEEHAVTFAAGLAKSGMKPFVAVYSTFAQRAYDQILHDVCIDGLPVTLCLDRAGLVGMDGATHQGLFDLSYLSSLPNMTVIAPKDVSQMKEALRFAMTFDGPLAIRYPKECDFDEPCGAIEFGKWQYIFGGNKDISVFVSGPNMLAVARDAAERCGVEFNLINTLFIKPCDTDMLAGRLKDRLWVTLEENQKQGGIGETIAAYSAENGGPRVIIMAVEDKFVPHMTIPEQLESCGLTAENLIKNICG
ncbi:MAG TPA: 1-deoxy-D-xylulose-5-phosphate synthase [Firmicutes bacterium]|nr:1-deoxy-D-xylulose-5-phosphate synthase [Bacillota bacterium]